MKQEQDTATTGDKCMARQMKSETDCEKQGTESDTTTVPQTDD